MSDVTFKALARSLTRLGVKPDADADQGELAEDVKAALESRDLALVECESCAGFTPSTWASCAFCGVGVAADLTDLGNCVRFLRRNIQKVVHCEGFGWMVYDGTRWTPDEAGAMRLAKATVRAIYAEAAETEEDATAIAAHATRSQSARAIEAMMKLAKTEHGIAARVDDFDVDPMLLNCPNGTLDLRTGELRPHSPRDLLTKITAAAYDPAARSELWERVLRQALGDQEIVAFFRRVLGYCATGSTAEEKLFVVLGPGASGKSTIVEACKRTLGSYAMTADFETFVAKSGGGIRNDVARLAGARFVSSIEVEQGRRLAEGLVKSVTGGDDVTARFLYKEAFTYRPQFKLVLVANDAPRARDDDTGLWRRIVRIPFENVVPKDKRDPKVKSELCDPAFSGPAILAWTVAGCMQWQKIGLAVPKAIEDATEAYRESQDPLAEFFADECVFEQEARASRSELRRRYEQWAEDAGLKKMLLMSPKEMAKRLRARGVSEGNKLAGERAWIGVRLADAEGGRPSRADFVDVVERPGPRTRGTRRDTSEEARVPTATHRDDDGIGDAGHLGHQRRQTSPSNCLVEEVCEKGAFAVPPVQDVDLEAALDSFTAPRRRSARRG